MPKLAVWTLKRPIYNAMHIIQFTYVNYANAP